MGRISARRRRLFDFAAKFFLTRSTSESRELARPIRSASTDHNPPRTRDEQKTLQQSVDLSGLGRDRNSASYIYPGNLQLSQTETFPSEHDSPCDGLNRVSVSSSTTKGPEVLDNDAEVISERPLTPVLSWKVPAVERLEPPLSNIKHAISEVSDLGDRYSYANQSFAGGQGRTDEPDLGETVGKDHLQNRFFEALVPRGDGKIGFFPRGLLSTLVTRDCVYQELSRCLTGDNPELIHRYTETICQEVPQPQEEDECRPPKIKSFKKIFAILVLIEETSSITKFIREDINDLNLPLSKHLLGTNGMIIELRLASDVNRRLEAFQDWSIQSRRKFEEWQWSALSPFFYKDPCENVKHFPLQPSIMLPFISDDLQGQESKQNIHLRKEIHGGNSKVSRVQIHPDHHNFKLLKDDLIGIKRLNSSSIDKFKQEVGMLNMFSNATENPHMVSLLATFEQYGQYSLIFPWADSDLYIYWSKIEPDPVFELNTAKWVLEQCAGIARAVAKIHHKTSNPNCNKRSHEHHEAYGPRYGRHMDIKPQNILWFANADGGTLKITDFGISEVSTTSRRSHTRGSSLAGSPSYRPPEFDLESGKIGQSFDIWTLGCLYLEFIAWLLGGRKWLQDFERERKSADRFWGMPTDTFFEIQQNTSDEHSKQDAAAVKPAVENFFNEVHAHPNCSEFIHEFINLIHFDVLVVKSTDSTEKRRITSEELSVKFTKMIDKSRVPEGGSNYLCKPAPWPAETPRMIMNFVLHDGASVVSLD